MDEIKTHESAKLDPPTAGDSPSATRRRPHINTDVAEFWEGVSNHKLLIQECDACGTRRLPFGPACPACAGDQWHTIQSAGRGAIYSFVTVHHPPVAGFVMPFDVGLIELQEGVRLLGVLHGADESNKLAIGSPVVVEFSDDYGFTYADFRLEAETI